jgi:hypothetical protein
LIQPQASRTYLLKIPLAKPDNIFFDCNGAIITVYNATMQRATGIAFKPNLRLLIKTIKKIPKFGKDHGKFQSKYFSHIHASIILEPPSK